ncbi:hypothetical protein GUJ93_ZPchr0001g29634 [Zizania palustris]|uniref:Uncharacterized protein n=1 Tax=Zizania palustris TaxID=103762 RepID=A0A8J5V7M5_ZIZPA|nr:hypothetical protein GUJ93_ZPchr0001g29634 [Zizania palustris]
MKTNFALDFFPIEYPACVMKLLWGDVACGNEGPHEEFSARRKNRADKGGLPPDESRNLDRKHLTLPEHQEPADKTLESAALIFSNI